MSASRGAGLFSCFSFTEGLVCVLSFLSVDLFILAHINLGLDHSLKGERSNSLTYLWRPIPQVTRVELASEM